MAFVKSFAFKETSFDEMGEYKYGKNWPVVYILEGKKEAYVGQTVDIYNRSHQHYKNEMRKKLDSVHVISDYDFNKSAISDIESLLIEHISADEKYLLQNNNAGLRNHRYYEKEKYQSKFEVIWKELKKEGIVNKDLLEIKNSDLFKYSPYKALTSDQYEVAQEITSLLMKEETSCHLVKGEPGSGKTILAVFLIKYLKQIEKTKDLRIGLVVPMTSLRGTIKKVFRNIKDLKASMVIGPNDVVKEPYDILIVDEAHRLNQRVNITSYSAFDAINKKLGLDKKTGTQLDWILKSAKHTVFFYDSHQSVKPSDINCNRFDSLNAIDYLLKSQLRVLGGQDYIDYVERILYQCASGKKVFDKYEFILFENVGDMVEQIKVKDKKYKLARVVAGYAWKWASNKDKKAYDIDIEGHQYRWNKCTVDWINSEDAIEEVGCIHTTQGYDLNYAGVIIGPEIVYRDGQIKIIPENYKDANGKATIRDLQVLKTYILNIYKTLMTRGIRGTYLYVCDEGLRNYFKQFVPIFPYYATNYKNIDTSQLRIAEETVQYKK